MFNVPIFAAGSCPSQAATCLQAVKTHCAFPLWMSNISTLTPAFWRSICSDAYESSIFLSQGVNGSAPFLSMQAQPMSLFSRSHLDDIRLFTCTFVVHSAARNFVSDFSCSCEEPYVFPHLMIFGSCERPTSAALTFFLLARRERCYAQPCTSNKHHIASKGISKTLLIFSPAVSKPSTPYSLALPFE
ncbi:hypothetical protein MVEN_00064700 [Mycena venus]|uniref:Uncharacterized protein n=1 Tax=Mycena venus TaxID=2733690 RepID=A0A8H6Z7L0_9AGAR|nr:hypothetical protein MVEN_00064700 [Mycena venus]